MRKLNWEEVTDAGDNNVMGAGGYAIKIVGVKDHEDDEFVEIIYDIAEGDLKGKYATETDDWKHSFRQYYNDKSTGFFKRFLSRLEDNNPSFSIKTWNNDPKAFIGLNTGMVFRERRYLNGAGEPKWALEADYPITLEDLHSEKFTIKEPRYTNTDEQEWTAIKNGATSDASSNASGESVYDDAIPF